MNRTVEEESFELKEEKELMELANNYLQNNLRSNSSHLIKPKHNKELYEKLYSACTGKKLTKKAFTRQDLNRSTGGEGEGVFKPILKGATAAAIEKKLGQPAKG
jgi:hypothetical protein